MFDVRKEPLVAARMIFFAKSFVIQNILLKFAPSHSLKPRRGRREVADIYGKAFTK